MHPKSAARSTAASDISSPTSHPTCLRDVTRRQRQLFVTAETYYGLGKAP